MSNNSIINNSFIINYNLFYIIFVSTQKFIIFYLILSHTNFIINISNFMSNSISTLHLNKRSLKFLIQKKKKKLNNLIKSMILLLGKILN